MAATYNGPFVDGVPTGLDLEALRAELTAAGIDVGPLGTIEGTRIVDQATGADVDLPAAAQAIVDAHVPPPPPKTPAQELDNDLAAAGNNIGQAIAALRKFARAQP